MTSKLFSAIIISLTILIFFLLVLPSYDKTRILLKNAEERESILKEEEEILNRIKSLSNEIEGNKDSIGKLERFLPKKKEIPELITNLEEITKNSGINLKEITISEQPGQEAIKKIAGSIKVSGDFPQFLSFLDFLEKNIRLIEIPKINITIQTSEKTKLLNYELQFETNYLEE